MKKIIFIIFSTFLNFSVSGQDSNFNFGPEIRGKEDMHKAFNEVSEFSQFKDVSSHAVNVLGKFNGHYVVLKKHYHKHSLLVFDDELELVKGYSLKNEEVFPNSKYIGVTVFNEEILVFFSEYSEVVGTAERGIYYAKLNQESFQLEEITLLENFPVPIRISRFDISVSHNEKFISYIINPKVGCKNYSFDAAVYDKNLKPVTFQMALL